MHTHPLSLGQVRDSVLERRHDGESNAGGLLGHDGDRIWMRALELWEQPGGKIRQNVVAADQTSFEPTATYSSIIPDIW